MRLKNKFKIAWLFSLTTLMSSNISFAEPTKDQKMMMNESFTMMDWFLYRNEQFLIDRGINKLVIDVEDMYFTVGESTAYSSFFITLDFDAGNFYATNEHDLFESPKTGNVKLTLDDGKKICFAAIKEMSESAPRLNTSFAEHKGFSTESYTPYSNPKRDMNTIGIKFKLFLRHRDNSTVNCEIPLYSSPKDLDKITYSFNGEW
ncbi:MAG: hypothetical protein ACI92O_001582 [Colwellia sp.]|jgi:hypothetical protein|tara:strand:- start:15147 stop:15758 length:612 start_codon:yes stop_codon:yes gene_type:complete